MNRTVLAALPIVAALTLTGCSTSPAPATETATPEPVGAQATYTPPDEPGMEQAVAEAALNRWLSNKGVRSIEGLDTPCNMIQEVESIERGTILLTVDDHIGISANPEADLHGIADKMLDSIGADFPEVLKITATDRKGRWSSSAFAILQPK